MVSRWRFPSFKGVDFRQRHSSRLLVVLCALVVLIIYFSDWTLFILAITYMFWGIFSRLFYGLSAAHRSHHRRLTRSSHAD